MGFFGNLMGNDSQPTASFSAKKTVKFIKNSSGESAVSLDKIEKDGGIDLRKKTESAGISLKKKNIDGIRAQVVVVLDHSYSMSSDYQNGKVQQLVERFLGFGLQVDEDGEIPIIPFDSRVKPTVNVNMSNYKNIVQNSIYKYSEMGSTNLYGALKELKKIVEKSDSPIYAAIVTDGEPNDRNSTTSIVKDLSQYPVFMKFLAIKPVNYLQELDDLSDSERLLDNVDSKFFSNVSNISDQEFADAMTDEWDSWVSSAKNKGVLSE